MLANQIIPSINITTITGPFICPEKERGLLNLLSKFKYIMFCTKFV